MQVGNKHLKINVFCFSALCGILIVEEKFVPKSLLLEDLYFLVP